MITEITFKHEKAVIVRRNRKDIWIVGADHKIRTDSARNNVWTFCYIVVKQAGGFCENPQDEVSDVYQAIKLMLEN